MTTINFQISAIFINNWRKPIISPKSISKANTFKIAYEEQSKKHTAFVCDFGIFEYNVIPLGIKTAPACY